jgi:protein-S-isoprenylcysteine O-methyltransferase Ste14
MKASIKTRPNSIPWPPILFGMGALAALVLGMLVPWPGLDLPAFRPVGFAAIFAGIALDISAMVIMHHHRANILPHRAATALVTSWPFSISRNPIYLDNLLLLVGAAPAFNNLWFLPMAVIVAKMVTSLAIKREEMHLAAMFGEEWQHYHIRAPQWFRLLP